jgi:hypothetical protein
MLKKLLTAAIVLTASRAASAYPGRDYQMWYNPEAGIISNCTSSESAAPRCQDTAPLALTIRQEDVGKTVTINAPELARCADIIDPSGAPLLTPSGRIYVDDFENLRTGYDSGAFFGSRMWSCSEIQTEAVSRLYWIEHWKTERARVQTLELENRLLRRRCGRRCR